MNRFFVDQSAINGTSISITDRDDIKHITKVLRMDIDEIVEISDTSQFEYVAKITSIFHDQINLTAVEKTDFIREPFIKIGLFQGMPKQGKMESIIQKSVELGANKIIPVYTERSVPQDKGNSKNKIERWQKVSDEAAKQCKRGILPYVSVPVTFAQLINELEFYDHIIFPYENEKGNTIKDALLKIKKLNKKAVEQDILGSSGNNIAIIIGPEGGFSKYEADKLVEIGAFCVSLGKTILRTETAGPAAISMVMYELEL